MYIAAHNLEDFLTDRVILMNKVQNSCRVLSWESVDTESPTILHFRIHLQAQQAFAKCLFIVIAIFLNWQCARKLPTNNCSQVRGDDTATLLPPPPDSCYSTTPNLPHPKSWSHKGVASSHKWLMSQPKNLVPCHFNTITHLLLY